MQAEGVICSQAEVEIEKDEKSGEYGKIRKIILHLKEEKMTSPQDEETKMVKRKSRGRSICKSGNSPCYNQRKAGKTRH